MRLDHLLSKERSKGCIAVWLLRAERAAERVRGGERSSPGRADGRPHERPGVHGGHAERGRNGGADGARRHNSKIPVADAKADRHAGRHNYKIPVAMRLGETPVLIPNTMVKT